jgi:8-oxo-dGTP pyrophosphatase MutT (NUDIX family)
VSRLPHEVSVLVHRPVSARAQLLTPRRSAAGGGYWHVVAGALEPGETHEQAAARELLEETGLSVQRLRHIGLPYRFPLSEEDAASRARYATGIEHVDGQCFAAEAPAGWEPRLDHEHVDHRWCQAREAARLVRWPDTAAALIRLGALLEAAA